MSLDELFLDRIAIDILNARLLHLLHLFTIYMYNRAKLCINWMAMTKLSSLYIMKKKNKKSYFQD